MSSANLMAVNAVGEHVAKLIETIDFCSALYELCRQEPHVDCDERQVTWANPKTTRAVPNSGGMAAGSVSSSLHHTVASRVSYN
jgi:hypothetical protein